MAQSLLISLKKHYPQLMWEGLVTPWVHDVVQYMPEISKTHIFPLIHGKIQWSERKKIAQQLHAHHFDVALVLPNNFKSALIPWFAKIPVRLGHLGEYRYGVLTHALPKKLHPTPQRMVDFYRHLLTLFDIEMTSQQDLPTIQVPLSQQQHIVRKFQIEGSVISIAPGAEYGSSKQWKAHHCATLIQEIFAQSLCDHIVLLGSAKDALFAQQILEKITKNNFHLGKIHNLCGQTNLSEAIQILSISQAVVANDSGLLHIASALNREVIGIYGSTSPTWAPPLGAHTHILYQSLDCSPCRQRECPLKHHRCMEEITPQQVLALLQRGLAQTQQLARRKE